MIIAGIVAGGTGSRMGDASLPKQFFELGGKPIVLYTAEQFLENDRIDYVIIGINPQWKNYTQNLIEQFFPDNKRLFVTQGGSDRNQTVCNIVRYVQEHFSVGRSDIILTHDAVRPFVTQRIINDSISALNECDICTAVIPSTDTVISSKDGFFASDFPNRSEIFQVQTPQTFRIEEFYDIYSSVSEQEKAFATDVCRLFHTKGKKVKLIQGDVSNIKLTYPYDYETAKNFLRLKGD